VRGGKLVDKLTPERLQRKAVVYVRQSSPGQMLHHLESKRLQYNLPIRAKELGFQQVEVIDEDQGRSGSGYEERPGFARLVALVCAGEVGGIVCLEASRLARNGRDWHHLLELCGLVGTVIIDPLAVYDPGVISDRFVLGLQGTMSEFEVSLFRQRSRQATQQKARRGELQFRLPAGLCWNADRMELTPDQQVQQALRLVFQKMEELGSARQVYLWFCRQEMQVPVVNPVGKVIWRTPRYSTIRSILCNPFYAGAYAFGRTQVHTRVRDGRARKSKTDLKRDPQRWMVLIRDHHAGYIPWEQYERNQQLMDANAHMRARSIAKAGRGVVPC
jgi:DNA invertase Pin-like site-specific DNA recombinase